MIRKHKFQLFEFELIQKYSNRNVNMSKESASRFNSIEHFEKAAVGRDSSELALQNQRSDSAEEGTRLEPLKSPSKEEKNLYIDATVLRESVTTKQEASNQQSALQVVKTQLAIQKKGGRLAQEAEKHPKFTRQCCRANEVGASTHDANCWQYKYDSVPGKSALGGRKARKGQVSAANLRAQAFTHKQFIPRKHTSTYVTGQKVKRYHTSLYQVTSQTSENENRGEDITMNHINKEVAEHIEDDLCKKILELEDYRLERGERSNSSEISSRPPILECKVGEPTAMELQGLRVSQPASAVKESPQRKRQAREVVILNKLQVTGSSKVIQRPATILPDMTKSGNELIADHGLQSIKFAPPASIGQYLHEPQTAQPRQLESTTLVHNQSDLRLGETPGPLEHQATLLRQDNSSAYRDSAHVNHNAQNPDKVSTINNSMTMQNQLNPLQSLCEQEIQAIRQSKQHAALTQNQSFKDHAGLEIVSRKDLHNRHSLLNTRPPTDTMPNVMQEMNGTGTNSSYPEEQHRLEAKMYDALLNQLNAFSVLDLTEMMIYYQNLLAKMPLDLSQAASPTNHVIIHDSYVDQHSNQSHSRPRQHLYDPQGNKIEQGEVLSAIGLIQRQLHWKAKTSQVRSPVRVQNLENSNQTSESGAEEHRIKTKVYEVAKNDGGRYAAHKQPGKMIKSRSAYNKQAVYGAGFNPSSFLRPDERQVRSHDKPHFQELRQKLNAETNAFHSQVLVEGGLRRSSYRSSEPQASLKKERLSVRGHEIQQSFQNALNDNKVASPLRIVVQSTSKNDFDETVMSRVQNKLSANLDLVNQIMQSSSGQLSKGVSDMHRITVPIANDVTLPDISPEDMAMESNPSAGLKYFNPDLQDLVSQHVGLMNFSVENEVLNVMARILHDEQNHLYRYKLDKTYHYRSFSPVGHRSRSQPETKLNVTSLAVDGLGNMLIKPVNAQVERIAGNLRKNKSLPRVIRASPGRSMIFQQQHMHYEQPLVLGKQNQKGNTNRGMVVTTLPNPRKISSPMNIRRKPLRDNIQEYARIIAQYGKNVDRQALIDLLIQKEASDMLLQNSQYLLTHQTLTNAAQGTDLWDQSRLRGTFVPERLDGSHHTSQTRVISYGSQLQQRQLLGGLQVPQILQTELNENQLTIEQQPSTLTRQVGSPGSRQQIFTSGDSRQIAQQYSALRHEAPYKDSVQVIQKRRGSVSGLSYQNPPPIVDSKDENTESPTALMGRKSTSLEYPNEPTSDLQPLLSIQSRISRIAVKKSMIQVSKTSLSIGSQKSDSDKVLHDMVPLNMNENTDGEDNSPDRIRQEARYKVQADLHEGHEQHGVKKIHTALQSGGSALHLGGLEKHDYLKSSEEIEIYHHPGDARQGTRGGVKGRAVGRHPITGPSMRKLRTSEQKVVDSSNGNSSEMHDAYEIKDESMQPIVSGSISNFQLHGPDRQSRKERAIITGLASPTNDQVSSNVPNSNTNDQRPVGPLKRRSLALNIPNRQNSMVMAKSGRMMFQADGGTLSSKSKNEDDQIQAREKYVNSPPDQDEDDQVLNDFMDSNQALLSGNVHLVDTSGSLGFLLEHQQHLFNQISQGQVHVNRSANVQLNELLRNSNQELQLLINNGFFNDLTRSAAVDPKAQQFLRASLSPDQQWRSADGDYPLPEAVHTQYTSIGPNQKHESSTVRQAQSTQRADEFSVAEMSAQAILDQNDLHTDASYRDLSSAAMKNLFRLDQLLKSTHPVSITLSPTSSNSNDVYLMIKNALKAQKLQHQALIDSSKSKLVARLTGQRLQMNSGPHPLPNVLPKQDDFIQREQREQFEVRGRRIYTIRETYAQQQLIQLIQNHIDSLQQEVREGSSIGKYNLLINEYTHSRLQEQEHVEPVQISSKEQVLKNQQTLSQIQQLHYVMEQLQSAHANQNELDQVSRGLSRMEEAQKTTKAARQEQNYTVNTLDGNSAGLNQVAVERPGSEHSRDNALKGKRQNLNVNQTPHDQRRPMSSGIASQSGHFYGPYGSSGERVLHSPRMQHANSNSRGPSCQQDQSRGRPIQDMDYQEQKSHYRVSPDLGQSVTRILDSNDRSLEAKKNDLNLLGGRPMGNPDRHEAANQLRGIAPKDIEEYADSLKFKRELAKKNPPSIEFGRKTTILSKSQNGELILGSPTHRISRMNKDSEELVLPPSLLHTKGEALVLEYSDDDDDQLDIKQQNSDQELASRENHDLDKTRKTHSICEKSAQKEREGESQFYQSGFQMNCKFSENGMKRMTQHDSEQHLSFYQITQPVMENSPRQAAKFQAGVTSATQQGKPQLISPILTSDMLYSGASSAMTAVKQGLPTPSVSTKPGTRHAANSSPIRIPSKKQSDTFELPREKQASLDKPNADATRAVDKITIERVKKSRHASSNNRIIASTQQLLAKAAPFKLPKQFDKMAQPQEADPSPTLTGEDVATNPLPTAKRTVALGSLERGRDQDHYITAKLSYHNTLLQLETKEREMGSNVYSPAQAASKAIEPVQASTIFDEQQSQRNMLMNKTSRLSQRLLKGSGERADQVVGSVAMNASRQPTLPDAGASQASQTRSRVNYLIKNPTQNDISSSRLIENSHVLRKSTAGRMNRLQSAAHQRTVQEQAGHAQPSRSRQYGRGGLLLAGKFCDEVHVGDLQTMQDGAPPVLQLQAQINQEKRLYSAISQPSNTHASTAYRRSQPENFAKDLASPGDKRYLAQYAQGRAGYDIRDSFTGVPFQPVGPADAQKARPQTAKVTRVGRNVQPLSKGLPQNNARRLMRLESAHDAIIQNRSCANQEAIAGSSSNHLFDGSKRPGSKNPRQSMSRLLSGTGTVGQLNVLSEAQILQAPAEKRATRESRDRKGLVSDSASNKDIQELISFSGSGHPPGTRAALHSANPALLSQSSIFKMRRANPQLHLGGDQYYTGSPAEYLGRQDLLQVPNTRTQLALTGTATGSRDKMGWTTNFGATSPLSRGPGRARQPQLALARSLRPSDAKALTRPSTAVSRAQWCKRLAKGPVFKDNDFEARRRDGRNGVIL